MAAGRIGEPPRCGTGGGRPLSALAEGCCYGKVTDVPWGIHFPLTPRGWRGTRRRSTNPFPPFPPACPRLSRTENRRREPGRPEQAVLWPLFLAGYGLIRLAVEPLRGEPVMGTLAARSWSLGVFLLGAAWLAVSVSAPGKASLRGGGSCERGGPGPARRGGRHALRALPLGPGPKEPFQSYGLSFRPSRRALLDAAVAALLTLGPLTGLVFLGLAGRNLAPGICLFAARHGFCLVRACRRRLRGDVFRGWVQTLLVRAFHPALAVAGASALFALSHLVFRSDPFFLLTFFQGW